jgi:ATP/maltotriose-dependent transcriptional regulator MalT
MAALLATLRTARRNNHRGTGGTSPDYLDTLLAAFTGQKPLLDTSMRATAAVTGFHPGALVEPLSAREPDVLRLLSDGRSNAEIARDLFVEQSTVKTHLIHLYRKLGVSSRTQAIARGRALRLLD